MSVFIFLDYQQIFWQQEDYNVDGHCSKVYKINKLPYMHMSQQLSCQARQYEYHRRRLGGLWRLSD